MATYKEIEKIYNSDGHLVVSMALNVLFALGSESLKRNPPTVDEVVQGNVFSEEFRQHVIDVAVMLANTDINVLLAIIQRVMSVVSDPRGETIPFLHPHNDEDGVCPICGSENLEYSPQEIDDFGTIIPWECLSCHSYGKAAYNSIFQYHFDVTDSEGNNFSWED